MHIRVCTMTPSPCFAIWCRLVLCPMGSPCLVLLAYGMEIHAIIFKMSFDGLVDAVVGMRFLTCTQDDGKLTMQRYSL
uniref:Uncharacterized protein n=1 Tax=Oryza brachyantha TaxID=4533 RepID=J3N6I1_ORYBR